jgi:hypothetical protein
MECRQVLTEPRRTMARVRRTTLRACAMSIAVSHCSTFGLSCEGVGYP